MKDFNFTKLRDKPIPIFSKKFNSNFYNKIEFDSKHKLFKERLDDVVNYDLNGDNFYYQEINPPYFKRIEGSISKIYLRVSLLLKLQNIDERLRKNGFELYIFDGFRTIELQFALKEFWLYKFTMLKKLKKINNIRTSNLKDYLFSVESNSDTNIQNNPPPHFTGGAVDLTIRKTINKEHLFMGSIFDDFSEQSHTDYFERRKETKKLTLSEEEAMKNRRFFYWILNDAGLINYPYEWWHYSFGDQIWAYFKKIKNAYYAGYSGSLNIEI
jgi:zinc D-Ala-D-Ala dipeptidase